MSEALRVVSWPAEVNRAEQPYNSLWTQSVRKQGIAVMEFSPLQILKRPDVWHIHWPDAILNDRKLGRVIKNLIGLWGLLVLARIRGTVIVWTIHNLSSHEGLHPRLERILWRVVTRSIDAHISLSNSAWHAAVARFPALAGKVGATIPLGHYRGVYPDDLTREEALERLGLPPHAKVITALGQVRPYKGLPGLIRAFRAVTRDDVRLLIAGRPDTPSTERMIREAAEGDDRIALTLCHVPADEIQLYLRAADLVALPFTHILNSASAVLALSFDCPVLVPALGSMSELQDMVGPQWVRLYKGDLDAAELSGALAWSGVAREASAPLGALEWPRIGRMTAELYEHALGRVRRS